MQDTIVWEEIQGKRKTHTIHDTLSESVHKNRDKDIARKFKALISSIGIIWIRRAGYT